MLAQYLIKEGIVTGPLERNTSYSRLDVLRRYILGLEQFKGGEAFLAFGVALHEVFLEDKFDTYNTLTSKEKLQIDAMVKSLRKHPVVQSLMEGGVSEEKLYGTLFNVLFAYIVDRKQIHLNRGFDLKSTSCSTQQQFEDSCKKYGYPKQGVVYKKLEGLKEFYFVGIQKQYPYNVYIVDTRKWKEEERYAERELEFFAYFYKHYGNFTGGEVQIETQTKNKMTGKEALKEMLLQLTVVVEQEKLIHKHTVARQREASKLKSLATKFPKNEKPLYQEQINKIISKVDGKK